MISQQLIEKYMELEEKRYHAAKASRYEHKNFQSAHRAFNHWNRVWVMYINPEWKPKN